MHVVCRFFKVLDTRLFLYEFNYATQNYKIPAIPNVQYSDTCVTVSKILVKTKYNEPCFFVIYMNTSTITEIFHLIKGGDNTTQKFATMVSKTSNVPK